MTIARATADLSLYSCDSIGALLDRMYINGVLIENDLLELTMQRSAENWPEPSLLSS